MSKQEFLEHLRLALNGRVSPGVVTENLNYYEDYINMEVRKGRTEEEVLAGLGDPRLLARTIVETHGGGNSGPGMSPGNSAGRTGGYYGGAAGQNAGSYGQNQDSGNGRRTNIRIPGWVFLILVLLVVVLILGAVFSVLSFLMPVLLPLLTVIFLVKLFRDWIN